MRWRCVIFVDELLSRQPVRREGNNLIYAVSGSDEWQARQDAAPDRYLDHADGDPTIARLFGGFIAVGTKRNDIILDIGCGIIPMPDYIAELGLSRFIGLEPLDRPLPDRDFPCLVGAVAEAIPLKDSSVDAVLFATSLDHIQAEDAAIDEVKRILKPDGRIIIWQGLHEPEMLPRQKSWERTMARPAIAAIPRAAAEAAVTARRMAKRKRDLAAGTPLDHVHFRYYTRKMIDASLARWGLTKVRELEPLGAPSIFVEAKPQHRPNP